ncbi:MAG: hypothetical protein IPL61_20330 [Myxococcales bacterium]|nr:hypothetical protein [Myxococcales bacterium]
MAGLVRLAAQAALAALTAMAACGGGGDGPLDGGGRDRDDGDGPDPFMCDPVIGDRTAPIELAPISAAGPDGTVLTDGAVVRMIAPPQGGIILLVGVRAKNVDGCAVQLTAALRDPGTNQVVGLESRPAQLRVGVDGWGVPVEAHFFSMANLAVCPAAAATRDLFDQPWLLELSVDDDGRQAMTSVTIVPSCEGVDPAWDCPCQCAADYQPGTCAALPDGGDGGV